MKNRSALTISAVVFLLTMLVATEKASAVPAFARQTGMPCAACHFQHYPALNDFGVMFKTNGYTMIGAQGKVEGKDLSLPDTLNASLVTKIRYQKSNGDGKTGTDKGELQFPDEGALLIGGRAGEHAGFLLELQLPEGDESAFASFRMPIVYDLGGTALSVVPFTTDAGGAAYGFELLNTGAMRMQRVLEDRNTTSAQQFIGTATAAQGIALVAEVFFAAGAESVYPGIAGMGELRHPREAAAIREARLGAGALTPVGFHPMGTARMGGDPQRSATDHWGVVRGTVGLHVADASLFPSCVGVNPQLTIMAFASRIARHLAAGAPRA